MDRTVNQLWVMSVANALKRLVGEEPRVFTRTEYWAMEFLPPPFTLRIHFWPGEPTAGALNRLAALLYNYRREWHPFYKRAIAK